MKQEEINTVSHDEYPVNLVAGIKNANILMGITRETVLTLIEDLGMKYKIADITQDDLYNADEAFFTGSASEVTPIRKIDNHEFYKI